MSPQRPTLAWPFAALLQAVLDPSDLSRALADLEDLASNGRVGRIGLMWQAATIAAWAMRGRFHEARLGPSFDRLELPRPRRRPMFGDVIRDLRFSLRALRRRPGFAALTIGVLALGIGANVAIFTLVSHLFFEPPALVTEPHRLVRLFRLSGGGYGSTLSFPDYQDYRLGATGLATIAAFADNYAATGRVGESSSQIMVSMVSEHYFTVLGIHPVTGRFFADNENGIPNGAPVAVVSSAFWRSRLGGALSAVGSEIMINGHGFTVIGVAPREFHGIAPTERRPDIYVPIMMKPAIAPQSDEGWRVRMPDVRDNWLSVVGRLEPRATLAQVRSALGTNAGRLYPPRPEKDAEGVFVTDKYRWFPRTEESLAGLTRLLVGAVFTLLTVAAANVAILLLARASTREREIGIRAAIGAGRNRVVRQLLTESVFLGLIGGLIGLALSVGAARIAGALLPVAVELPSFPDSRVVGFALALSLVTSVGVGLLPAFRASRVDVVSMMRGRPQAIGGGAWRDGLVTAQVALSLMLVAGAALFARSFAAARAFDVGFDPANTLLLRADLTVRQYDATRGRVLVRQSLEQIGALPGVKAAAVTATVPFEDEWSTELTAWPGSSFSKGERIVVGLNAITPAYFDAIGIPIVRGRGIEAADGESSQPVVVISESFARAAFGGADPIGRTIPMRGADGPQFVVVGIAKDATYYSFGEERKAMAYGSAMQFFRPHLAFMVKTVGDPEALAPAVERTIHALDPDLPFRGIRTLESLYDAQLAGYRASATVVGLAGLVALVLASAGLYGVMAFRVVERTREIGVRMALGASRQAVAGAVMRRGLRLTAIGLGLGLAGAIATMGLVRAQLYGIPARDPLSIAGAILVLVSVAVIAVMVPARRAMSVDPTQAMRAD